MTLALEVKNLSLEFKNRPVLEDITFSVNAGDFVGLIGPNGAGKTALLKVILGLYRPASGSIKVFGKSPLQARGLVGYVPQHAHFDADYPINVLDVVLMGRLGARKTGSTYSKKDREIAFDALERVVMQDLAKRQIGKLSGGELQRVLIARALATEATLLLFDEPTSSLDTRIGHTVYHVLEELNKTVTIILVSHDVGVVSSHVKSIACINRKLHFHPAKEITGEMLEEVYGCPLEFLAHGHAHRVLPEHGGDK